MVCNMLVTCVRYHNNMLVTCVRYHGNSNDISLLQDGSEGELSLLANLLGTASSTVSGTLKIDLFNDHYLDMEPAKEAASAPLTKSDSGGIRIDVKRGDRSTLLNIANVSLFYLTF